MTKQDILSRNIFFNQVVCAKSTNKKKKQNCEMRKLKRKEKFEHIKHKVST